MRHRQPGGEIATPEPGEALDVAVRLTRVLRTTEDLSRALLLLRLDLSRDERIGATEPHGVSRLFLSLSGDRDLDRVVTRTLGL